MTLPDLVEERSSLFVTPRFIEIVSTPIRPQIKIVSYTSEQKVLVREGSMEMIETVFEKKHEWVDLHIRHKVRVIIAITLLFLGMADLSLNLFHIPALFDAFSDVLWVIGSFGLLGTATYLALDEKSE